jgi:membrane fusion protein (multidrug efflux system)
MEETPKSDQRTASSPGASDVQPARHKAPFWIRNGVIIAGSILLAGILFLGLHYLAESLTHESTDDAFLDGNIVSIAPRIPGQVQKVYVDQNQSVEAGTLLFEIDPRDYEIQLAQKKSARVAAQANEGVIKASFELLANQVEVAEATAKQSEAEAAADQAKAEQAIADLKRAEDLNERKIISPQEYDTARTAASAAKANLLASQQKAVSDRSKVASAKAQLQAGRKAFDRAVAQSEQAGVDVQQAELTLSYARATAPGKGRISRKAIETGDYVQAGQRVMALVLSDIWVTANFKETQLKKIRVGQHVDITIDSVSGRTFPGHVQSIQAGSGAAFSLLPPENAVGNFVKVVQRVPVRIFFDGTVDTAHVLGPGMSVVPSVHVSSFEISDLVVIIVALLLGLVSGFFWKKAAIKQTSNGKR